jgi:hypothetical protein
MFFRPLDANIFLAGIGIVIAVSGELIRGSIPRFRALPFGLLVDILDPLLRDRFYKEQIN